MSEPRVSARLLKRAPSDGRCELVLADASHPEAGWAFVEIGEPGKGEDQPTDGCSLVPERNSNVPDQECRTRAGNRRDCRVARGSAREVRLGSEQRQGDGRLAGSSRGVPRLVQGPRSKQLERRDGPADRDRRRPTQFLRLLPLGPQLRRRECAGARSGRDRPGTPIRIERRTRGGGTRVRAGSRSLARHSEDDVRAARAKGLGDGELAEVVALVAINSFTNYFNKTFEVDLDFPLIDPHEHRLPG